MLKAKFLTILCIILFFFSYPARDAYSDMVKLKSGNSFIADILERNDRHLKAKVFGVDLTFYNDEIESVDQQSKMVANNSRVERRSKNSVLNDFIKGIYFFDNEVGAQLDRYTRDVNSLMEAGQKDQAINVVVQEINLLTQKSAYLQSLSAPSGGFKLQDSVVKYYKSMLAVQTAVLKYISDLPGAAQAVEAAIQRMTNFEESFQSEITRTQELYEVTLPATGINSREIVRITHQEREGAGDNILQKNGGALGEASEKTFDSSNYENDVLAQETRELIEVNKKLLYDTRAQLEENKKIREEMIDIIKVAIDHLDREQKMALLRHLKSI